MIYMTLNKIAKFNPCESSWSKALTLLNKTEADDTKVSLLQVLENMSLQDTIWCMQVNWFEHKDLYMQFVNNCVKRVESYNSADADADAAYADAAYAYAYADAAATAVAADAARAAASAYAAAAYAADAARAAAAAAYAADAAAAAYAADAAAADDAADAAYAAAAAAAYAYAAAAAAERQLQYEDLKQLLLNHKEDK